jgi:hypothetical protein
MPPKQQRAIREIYGICSLVYTDYWKLVRLSSRGGFKILKLMTCPWTLRILASS